MGSVGLADGFGSITHEREESFRPRMKPTEGPTEEAGVTSANDRGTDGGIGADRFADRGLRLLYRLRGSGTEFRHESAPGEISETSVIAATVRGNFPLFRRAESALPATICGPMSHDKRIPFGRKDGRRDS